MMAFCVDGRDEMAKDKAAASEGKKVDTDAPASLILEFKTPSGEVWGTITADAKTFSTGSVGFYANGKIKNPKNGFPYQVGTNVILIGSKG
jgi:hypothetical protein